jgi:hypothetical protein
MCDESWIYGYDSEIKQQLSQCKTPHSPREKKVWQVQSATKSMLIVLFFFNVKGIVPPNTMIDSDFYCDVLRCLKENVQRKRQEFLAQPQLVPSS